MYPEQQPQPQPEQRPPYQPPVVEQAVAPKKSLKLPIILMVWPAASLIIVVLLYAVVNMMFAPTEGDLYGDQGPVKTIINVLLFIIGAAGACLGPVSFIVGLVLLIQRKTKH